MEAVATRENGTAVVLAEGSATQLAGGFRTCYRMRSRSECALLSERRKDDRNDPQDEAVLKLERV
jgi:hypothetical protein